MIDRIIPDLLLIMKLILSSLLALAITSPTFADSIEEDIEGFIQGKYTVIGKRPDSANTYHGTLSISSFASGMAVSRVIANEETIGSAKIVRVTADKIPVLQMSFREGGREYVQSCMIDSDLDNYARITCQTVASDGTTRLPGMEALFIRR